MHAIRALPFILGIVTFTVFAMDLDRYMSAQESGLVDILVDSNEKPHLSEFCMSGRGFLDVIYRHLPSNSEVTFSGEELQSHVTGLSPTVFENGDQVNKSINKGSFSFRHAFHDGKLFVWQEYEKKWPSHAAIDLALKLRKKNEPASNRPAVTVNGGREAAHIEYPLLDPNMSFITSEHIKGIEKPRFKAYIQNKRAMLRADFSTVQVDMFAQPGYDLPFYVKGCVAGIILASGRWEACTDQTVIEGF